MKPKRTVLLESHQHICLLQYFNLPEFKATALTVLVLRQRKVPVRLVSMSQLWCHIKLSATFCILSSLKRLVGVLTAFS